MTEAVAGRARVGLSAWECEAAQSRQARPKRGAGAEVEPALGAPGAGSDDSDKQTSSPDAADVGTAELATAAADGEDSEDDVEEEISIPDADSYDFEDFNSENETSHVLFRAPLPSECLR